jgi:hypothetical protein
VTVFLRPASFFLMPRTMASDFKLAAKLIPHGRVQLGHQRIHREET